MTTDEIKALADKLARRSISAETLDGAAAALRQLAEERADSERFLRALMDTAQWNADAPGGHEDKLAWKALALSIAAHEAARLAEATLLEQPSEPLDGQT